MSLIDSIVKDIHFWLDSNQDASILYYLEGYVGHYINKDNILELEKFSSHFSDVNYVFFKIKDIRFGYKIDSNIIRHIYFYPNVTLWSPKISLQFDDAGKLHNVNNPDDIVEFKNIDDFWLKIQNRVKYVITTDPSWTSLTYLKSLPDSALIYTINYFLSDIVIEI